MKLVAYLRVSGASQANDGFGLDTQRDGIKKWAKENQHEIVHEITDAGVSGTREGLARPGFRQAVEMIETNLAEGLVTYDMTRIARTLIIQETALGILWDVGASIFTVAEGLIDSDDKDGTRTLVRQIMGAFAEFQRTNLVMKTREGKLRAKAAGQHTDGIAPYGYRVENKHLVEDMGQQSVIGEMLSLRRSGLSYDKIVDMLNKDGIRSPKGNDWTKSTLYDVMKRAI